MSTRRVALCLAALTALATLPVLGAAPAGASGAVLYPTPAARGEDNGDPEGPDGNTTQEEQNNCPTEMWTVPLEIKGLACILLLPKPEKGDEDEGGGGLGGLFG
ncbi:MAG TPA: hypothetical protein VG795_06940 [Acidimicrobiia bacterium]|nr:hypothetical protein [Acidimicrobiia bacterium]